MDQYRKHTKVNTKMAADSLEMTEKLKETVHGLPALIENMSLEMTGEIDAQSASSESEFVAMTDKIDKVEKTLDS